MIANRKQITAALTCAQDDDSSWLTFDKATGYYTVRRGFFYGTSGTPGGHAARVVRELTEAGIKVQQGDHGQVWKAFKGGATIKGQSHWWVQVRPVD